MKSRGNVFKNSINNFLKIFLANPGILATIATFSDAGWSSLVARRAHNPKVVGSNPAPATKFSCICSPVPFFVQLLFYVLSLLSVVVSACYSYKRVHTELLHGNLLMPPAMFSQHHFPAWLFQYPAKTKFSLALPIWQSIKMMRLRKNEDN